MLSNDDINIIADLIEEEVSARVNESLNDFGAIIKEYVDSSINNLLIENNNQSYDDNVVDTNTRQSQREMLRENFQTLFSSAGAADDDDDWETLPVSGDARTFGHQTGRSSAPVNSMQIKSLLPPDEGQSSGMSTEPMQAHTNSVLDIAGGLQDDSLTKALTKNYSGMFKK